MMFNRKSFALLFVVIFLVSSFTRLNRKFDRIQGELAFEKISFLSLYDVPDSIYSVFLENIDAALTSKNSIPEYELELYEYFDELRKADLLRSPYISFLVEEDSVLNVYLTERQYEKVKKFKHLDLIRDNNKVVLDIHLDVIDDRFYFSDSIYSVKLVPGKTYPYREIVEF